MGRYYNECPVCGAHLDPGEPCDCKDEREIELRKRKALNYTLAEMLDCDNWSQEELSLCS